MTDLQQRVEEIRSLYPNLAAILHGTVSGQITEWPMIRGELEQLLNRIAAAERVVEAIRPLLDFMEHLERYPPLTGFTRQQEVVNTRALKNLRLAVYDATVDQPQQKEGRHD